MEDDSIVLEHYRWSNIFLALLISLNAIVLFSSYWMAAMADKEPDLGLKALLGFISQGSLVIGMLTIFLCMITVAFKAPGEESSNWLKRRLD